ncbi:hypothetical protein EW026_g7267 [Hermanssonia centrifuga]|uniref:Amino acid permease/ SLC12A domain-containing protein n=1 Tax=Hermanssonia centrifuga TaxID=98765 RepID=A0A4S4K8D8_9APHY|nr:hypothetical protein EW026_g7267 [Hermanssonia centrifuga]
MSSEGKLEYQEKVSDNVVEPYPDSEANVPVYSGSTLHRTMKNRHIAMISIGGVIGTGLFLGTAGVLATGGPIGLLLGYVVVGTICYAVMVSLGEMISYLPIPGGHITLAERFVDPAWSFTLGWNYWYNWVIILPAELSASAVLIGFWNNSVNDAAWITIFLVIVIVINMLGARAYGEAEFVFASIKVFTITGLIILGIVLDLGGGPNHDRIGFRYWKNPGPFAQFGGIAGSKIRFLAWWNVMTQAAFSFIGTEIVAIAGGVTIIGLLVPYTEPDLNLKTSDAAKSPFVITIKTTGIKGLPSVINAALLTSAWSAVSSDLYTSSRALYGLALNGNAPKVFARVSSWASLMSLGAGRVFIWFANLTAIAGLMTWFGIAVTYIRFHKGMKAQGMDRNALLYKAPFQPFLAWYAAISCIVICFFSAFAVFINHDWDTATFVTNYLPFILFPIIYIGAHMWWRSSFIAPEDMDFKSGLAEVEAASYDKPPPRNWVEKVWGWLM